MSLKENSHIEFIKCQHQALMREKSERDYYNDMAYSRQQGIEQGEYNKSIAIAENLLKNNIDLW